MEIGNWKSTADLNDIYVQIREPGLETNLAELKAFGFTTIEDALSPDQVDRARDAISDELLEKHKDHPQFAALMGQDTMYGWTEEGPDLDKMRANPAGRAWHS